MENELPFFCVYVKTKSSSYSPLNMQTTKTRQQVTLKVVNILGGVMKHKGRVSYMRKILLYNVSTTYEYLKITLVVLLHFKLAGLLKSKSTDNLDISPIPHREKLSLSLLVGRSTVAETIQVQYIGFRQPFIS